MAFGIKQHALNLGITNKSMCSQYDHLVTSQGPICPFGGACSWFSKKYAYIIVFGIKQHALDLGITNKSI